MSTEIWLVDDDKSIRWVLETALDGEGYQVRSFDNADSALAMLAKSRPTVLVTDIRMPGTDGLELLRMVHESDPTLPVVVMTAHSDLDSALAAYSGGAFEYIPKPFDLDDALATITRAMAERDNVVETNPSSSTGLIGNARSMQEVFRLIGRLSKSDLSVLITGETGSGKEVVASALHKTSPRAAGPFVALNTAAIPAELLESELFGHEKGAFTGAQSSRTGRFEQADGGTLFLDEIGDMPASMQTRLLRVLAQGEFFRVGGHQLIKVDVRIIAATHQDLEKSVNEGKFREDLYHRLNVVRLRLPPLRERKEDIPELIQHFLARAAEETRLERKHIDHATMEILKAYNWPGNVRELENLCRRLTVMSPGDTIRPEDLPAEFRQGSKPVNGNGNWQEDLQHWVHDALKSGEEDLAHKVVSEAEKIMLNEALNVTAGHKQQAARLLGWGRNTLTRKLPLLGNQ